MTTHRLELLVVIAAAVYFAYLYITDPVRPGLATDGGWLSYFDQGAYMKQAVATKAGNLGEYYVYAPLYPLLAVPFLWLGLYANSLFFFNIFAFAFIAFAVFRYVRAVGGESLGLVAAMALIFATPLVHYTIVPWNSTVCLVSIGLLILVASSKQRVFSNGMLAWLALAGGLAFGARYIDIIWIFIAAAALIVLRGQSWKKVMVMGAMTFVLCIPALWTHQVVFGSPLKTPYVLHTSMNGDGVTDQNLGAYSLKRIPNAAYGMFVSPLLAGAPDSARGLLASSFWLLAAFAFPFARRIPKEHRTFLLILLGLAVLHCLFYLSFRASGPGAVRFGTLHYFKMFWPVFTILAVLTVNSLLPTRASGATSSRSRKR